MDSASRGPRPVDAVMSDLRAGKEALRASRRALPIEKKVALLLEMQRAFYPLLQAQGPLPPWKKPWNIEP